MSSAQSFPASSSFLSPEPAAVSGKAPSNKFTLSGEPGRRLKIKHLKRKLERAPVVTPLKTKPGKKLKLTPAVLETAASKPEKKPASGNKALPLPLKTSGKKSDTMKDRPRHKAVEGVSDRRQHVATPTRKLEFAPTPIKKSSGDDGATQKEARARSRSASSSSSSSSSSASSSSSNEEEEKADGYSSDECEVAFDAKTFGNIRVVREAQSPVVSIASTSTSTLSGTPPVGVEYQFAVSSTVSSIAVSPKGDFLVAGFNNGNVYLYPMSKDSFRFRRGVLLDHISARGMYTQLRLRVAIPDDGKFIFAGVYRGSMEIRAYEVDSIKFPTDDESSERPSTVTKKAAHDSDDSMDEEEEDDMFGMPMAKAVSHTYSDAKLKGFGAVKSVFRPETNSTEYHLLCGLGIKNLHLWRFFYQPSAEDGSMEWSWECIFDKQTNGISLEYLSFHRSIPNRIISKSEHQNIRVWDLQEEYDGKYALKIKKQSHTDVKHTTDAVAVYDDHAYGGSESLAVVDLRTASRMELDLPLSAKEQRAQQEVSNTRVAAYQRAYNPRGSRRRGAGAAEENGMRHMRTVTQVAGRDLAPFTVGMCSDGSVFIHQPEVDGMGLAAPLEYIEGYEQFFQDPSLDFQAQFSDLTRVNKTGLIAVLPLPAICKKDDRWLIVAANEDQLLVRSLRAFLHRSRQLKEYSQVKSGLRKVMRDLGQGASSDDDDAFASNSSSEDSDNEAHASDDQSASKQRRMSRHDATKVPANVKKAKSLTSKASSRPPKAATSKLESVPSSKSEKKASKREKKDKVPSKDNVSKSLQVRPDVESSESSKVKPSVSSPKDDQEVDSTAAAMTTPRRSTGNTLSSRTGQAVLGGVTPSAGVPSPVVSISSPSSASSNPNTPEKPGLSLKERQAMLLKELEWTPPARSKDGQSTGKENEPANAADQAAGHVKAKKKTKARMKIETLFNTNDEDAEMLAAASTIKADKSDDLAVVEKRKTKPATKRVLNRTKELDVTPSVVSTKTDEAKLAQEKPEESVGSKIDADVDMEGDDDDVDAALDATEASELVFESVPLRSDGGLLLSASVYQYSDTSSSMDTHEDLMQDAAVAFNEEASLLIRFARQNARLRTNFSTEKARVYKQLECSRASLLSCQSRGAKGPGVNWKKGLSAEYARRKHLMRRQKKQLAARLQQLHADFAAQVRDLHSMQRLEADALRARLMLRQLHAHVRHADAPLSSLAAPCIGAQR